MIRITPELISKERCQHWYGHLAKLDEMQHRFLPAAGPFDVGSTMANIVCEAGSKPSGSTADINIATRTSSVLI